MIYNDLPQLSQIIQYGESSQLLEAQARLEDLAIVTELGKFNRETCLRRFFDSYFLCQDFEDNAKRVFDLPYNIVNKQASTVALGVLPNPKRKTFLKQLKNMRIKYKICARLEEANIGKP